MKIQGGLTSSNYLNYSIMREPLFPSYIIIFSKRKNWIGKRHMQKLHIPCFLQQVKQKNQRWGNKWQ